MASGDEFFHYLHDADGYTIIQDAATGYYTYAVRDGENIKASEWIAGKTNPVQTNLSKHILPSETRLREIVAARRAYYQADRPSRLTDISKAPPAYVENHGILNNLVIFIRFSDEPETIFDKPFSYFDNICNGSVSLRSYYEEVSYGLLTIPSTFYPTPNGTTVLSYQDSHPRSYYQPYSSNNPNGYQESQLESREHTLLANAITAIASQVPANLDIDMNKDGYVDGVSFFISGYSGGNWDNLLWPHRWMLYAQSAYIHGKRVYDYLLVPVDTRDFDLSTLCHETFHVLGAPDLYHYDQNYDHLYTTYTWDIMESPTTTPQHMGAYMKHHYGNWIADIPTISPGRYTLSPLNTSSANNCYKIPVPGNSQQFYVVEYRRRPGSGFESSIPGSGLLVYRIDSRFGGNADYNGSTKLDEVYIFRPGGTQTANGTPTQAHFSQTTGRTKFNKTTNPRPWINYATNEDYTSITEVSEAGETISFVYGEYGKVAWINITMPDTIVVDTLVPLAATVLPSDAANKTLTWQITGGHSNAHINGANLVGDAAGTVSLQATAQDGSGIVAIKTIYVAGRILVDSIVITTDDDLYIGASVLLTATVFPAEAMNKTLSWNVTNSAGSAHIDGNNLVGDVAGVVIIQATAQDGSGVSASKTIEVRPRLVDSIAIIADNSLYTGSSIPFTATVFPSDATDKTLSWSVSNTSGSAHIDGANLVADAVGTVALQATAQDGSGISAVKTIEVLPVLVTGIDIVTKSTVYVSESIPLTATVRPENATNKALLWSVMPASGQAHIAGNTLVGDESGKIILFATAQDGSGVQAYREIAVRPYDEKGSVKVSWMAQYGADGFLTVESEKGLYRVEVYSTSGAKIKEYPASGQTIQLSFAGLPKGVYVLLVWHDKTNRSAVKVMW
jgi:M6 family metalloprotease-like protein